MLLLPAATTTTHVQPEADDQNPIPVVVLLKIPLRYYCPRHRRNLQTQRRCRASRDHCDGEDPSGALVAAAHPCHHDHHRHCRVVEQGAVALALQVEVVAPDWLRAGCHLYHGIMSSCHNGTRLRPSTAETLC